MNTSPIVLREKIFHTELMGVSKYLGGTILLAFSLANAGASVPHQYGEPRALPIVWPRTSPLTASSSEDASPATTKVAGWLDDLEGQLGMTRAGLATLLGVSRQTLYHWANGSELRGKNAQRLQAVRSAAHLLRSKAPQSDLPALWQYQVLPSLGLSFVQGMRGGRDPLAMAEQLVALWDRDAEEDAAMDALFVRGG